MNINIHTKSNYFAMKIQELKELEKLYLMGKIKFNGRMVK